MSLIGEKQSSSKWDTAMGSQPQLDLAGSDRGMYQKRSLSKLSLEAVRLSVSKTAGF
jgi:hypothetical protein